MVLASVIIPARNAGATLAACLDGLAGEGVPGQGVELLVVDDASTDCTRAIASRPRVRLLSGTGNGPAAARNLGARSATGDVLIFLDADTMPCRGWLRAMLEPLENPGVAAVKGRYYSSQRNLVARYIQLEFEEKYARLEKSRSIDFVDTGTAAFRRAAFEGVGGFDESFPAQSAEDVELAFRLAARGACFAFNPSAGVWHRHAERLREFLIKKARYGYFRVEVYRRHPRKTMGDAYTPPVMRLQIGLAGLCMLIGALALGKVNWAGWGLAGALATFGLTTLPLVKRAGSHQPDLVACVPALAFARASVQGFGVVAGLAMLLGRRLRG
jgi:cellulose synthase/poly-beta-1,6-N-acetylglucosamine synthase-like glycosyltransferase